MQIIVKKKYKIKCVFLWKKKVPKHKLMFIRGALADVMNDASMFSLFIVRSFKVGHGWFTTGCAT